MGDEYVDTNVCTTCPAGTTNAAGDDASGSDTSCTAIICLEDQYVSSNSCTNCSAGFEADAGSDASGNDTACTVIPCNASALLLNAVDVGDCNETLAGGDTCIQTAEFGYTCTASSCASDGSGYSGRM